MFASSIRSARIAKQVAGTDVRRKKNGDYSSRLEIIPVWIISTNPRPVPTGRHTLGTTIAREADLSGWSSSYYTVICKYKLRTFPPAIRTQTVMITEIIVASVHLLEPRFCFTTKTELVDGHHAGNPKSIEEFYKRPYSLNSSTLYQTWNRLSLLCIFVG